MRLAPINNIQFVLYPFTHLQRSYYRKVPAHGLPRNVFHQTYPKFYMEGENATHPYVLVVEYCHK